MVRASMAEVYNLEVSDKGMGYRYRLSSGRD